MNNLKDKILNSVNDSLIPNKLSDIKNQYYLNNNKTSSFYKNKWFWAITTPVVSSIMAFTLTAIFLTTNKAGDYTFSGKNKAIELSTASILNINDVLSSTDSTLKGLKLLNFANKGNFEDGPNRNDEPWEDDWYVPGEDDCGRNHIDFMFETINGFVNTIDMIISNDLPTYEIIKSTKDGFSYEVIINDSYSLFFNEEVIDDKYIFNGEIKFSNETLVLTGYKSLTGANSPFIINGSYANFDISITNYEGDLFKCDYSFTKKKNKKPNKENTWNFSLQEFKNNNRHYVRFIVVDDFKDKDSVFEFELTDDNKLKGSYSIYLDINNNQNDYYIVEGYCEIYSENSNWEIFNFITYFLDDKGGKHIPPEDNKDDYNWHNDYHHHHGKH